MNKFTKMLSDARVTISNDIKVRIFKLLPNGTQRRIIQHNACIFLGLKNLQARLNNDGNVVGAMNIEVEAYDYLYDYIIFCQAVGIDPASHFTIYTPLSINELNEL